MRKLSEAELESLTAAVNRQLKAWQGALAPEVSAVQVGAVLDKARLIEDAAQRLEPLYQADCATIQGYLDELPTGSYFQKMKDGRFSVKVYRPMSKGGFVIFTEGSFAAAYEKAMQFVAGQEKANG